MSRKRAAVVTTLTMKRPRSFVLCHTTSKVGTTNTKQDAMTPTLPLDVWHVIANHLPPRALQNLAITSGELHTIATRTLHRKLWQSILTCEYDSLQGAALYDIISLMSSTPSLRAMRICHQVYLLWHKIDVALPASVCFTKEEAIRFLDLDACVLSRTAKANVASRSSTREFPNYISTTPYPPSRCIKGGMYPLSSIFDAALSTHGNFNVILPFVRKEVIEDHNRFDNAKAAQVLINRIAGEKGVHTNHIEYCLGACAKISAFRAGTWDGQLEQYTQLVSQLVQMHCTLDKCYRYLLMWDGNARLKAKRLLSKLFRVRVFDVDSYVRTLEASLWWAKSDSNMKMMRKDM